MCDHIENENVYNQPIGNRTVYKDECVYCFNNPFTEDGLNLCLTCFMGVCAYDKPNNLINHTALHREKTGHTLYLNIKQIKETTKTDPTEITKLAINKEGGGMIDLDVITTTYQLICLECNKKEANIPDTYKTLIKQIEDHHSPYKQTQLEAWELDLKTCQHAKKLLDNIEVNQSGAAPCLDKCQDCDLKSNLWFCLACGNVGCGRKFYDGTGGNNHGIDHYKSTTHCVNIKLGTLNAEGNPSTYCYACDDDVKVNDLKKILLSHGIDMNSMTKTEKTINEMSLEYNLNFELSKNFEKDGKLDKIDPLYKPNGLVNIGNSCYINALIQCLFSFDEIRNAFSIKNPIVQQYIQNFSLNPANSIEMQLIKLITTLNEKEFINDKLDIKPYMFRYLVGKDNLEFRTQKQQDTAEYYSHLLPFVVNAEKKMKTDRASSLLNIEIANMVTCSQCSHYYIRNNVNNFFSLNLEEKLGNLILENQNSEDHGDYQLNLLELFKNGVPAQDEVLQCKNCNAKKIFNSRLFINKFPKYIVFKVQNFQMVNFNAKKLHINLNFDEDNIDLGYLDLTNVGGANARKMELSEEIEFNMEFVHQLMSMGFTMNRSKRALMETSNNLENAVNLLFSVEHDSSYDEPINPKKKDKKKKNDLFDQIKPIVGVMGCSDEYIKKVCLNYADKTADFVANYIFENPFDNGTLMNVEENENDDDEEVEIIDNGKRIYEAIGGVVHLGKNAHVGHYVSYSKREVNGKREWVYFNDDQVYKPEKAKIGKSYLLFLKKID